MSYRTVTFKGILEGVATRLGLEPARNLERNQAAALTEYIQDKLARAWELAAWPGWTYTEERQYRADYDNAVAYVIGDEVYYPTDEKYYVAIQAGTGNLPTDAAFWSEATDLDTYIARDQAWEANQIGVVRGVFFDDPRENLHPRAANHWVSPNGIQVFASTPKLWVEFSLPVPRFTATEYAAATAYVVGDGVYYPATGECYVAIQAGTGNPPTNTAFWTIQLFPAVLARHVKYAARAEALAEDDAFDKAAVAESISEAALSEALDQESDGMRPLRFNVVTR